MTQLFSNDLGLSDRSKNSTNRAMSGLPGSAKVLIELLDRYLKGGKVHFQFGDIEASAGTGNGFDIVLCVKDVRLFSRVLRYGNLG